MSTNTIVARDFSDASELEGKKPTKINFVAPFALVRRVKLLASENNQTQSEIIRKALELFITKYEKEKTASEIEEACRFYYKIDKKIAADWRNAEPQVARG